MCNGTKQNQNRIKKKKFIIPKKNPKNYSIYTNMMLKKYQQTAYINKSITISMGEFADSPNSFLCFTTNSKRIYMVLLGGANT